MLDNFLVWGYTFDGWLDDGFGNGRLAITEPQHLLTVYVHPENAVPRLGHQGYRGPAGA